MGKSCSILMISDTVVKSTLLDRILFKASSLALVGISTLLIKYIVQTKVTEYIDKEIVPLLTGSKIEGNEWIKKEKKILNDWREREKIMLTKWKRKKTAAFKDWKDKHVKLSIEQGKKNDKMIDEVRLYLLFCSEKGKVMFVAKLKEMMSHCLIRKQQKSLSEIKQEHMEMLVDLKLLKTKMLS